MEELHKKIESYLGGDMSPEDKVRFEKEVQADAELQKELIIYERINFHVTDHIKASEIPDREWINKLEETLGSDEINEIKDRLAAYAKKHNNTPQPLKRRTPYKLLIAALLTIACLSTVFLTLWNSNSTDKLYAAFYNESDLPSFTTRNTPQNALNTAVLAYKNGGYEEALQEFDTYLKTEKVIDTTVFLYVGMTQLQLGQEQAAIKSLDRVANSQLLDKSMGLWFKALALLKMDNSQQAKAVLQDILKNPENFKYTEARELLGKL